MGRALFYMPNDRYQRRAQTSTSTPSPNLSLSIQSPKDYYRRRAQTITISAEHKRSLSTPTANRSFLSYALFGYHSIDKKYLWVFFKFDGRLSILFAIKLDCLSFLQMAGFERFLNLSVLQTDRCRAPNFL
jgi:hypothetical protein